MRDTFFDQLLPVHETTRAGLRLTDLQFLRHIPRPGAGSYFGWCAEFQLPLLNKQRVLFGRPNITLEVTASNGLYALVNTGSQGPNSATETSASAEQLASAGVSLNTTDVFQVYSSFPLGNGSPFNRNRYVGPLVVNGISLKVPNAGQGSGVHVPSYTYPGIKRGVVQGDLVLRALYFFTQDVSDAYLPGYLKTLYNHGRLADPLRHPLLAPYLHDVVYFDTATLENGAFVGLKKRQTFALMPGLSKQAYESKLAGMAMPYRGGAAAVFPVAGTFSRELKDYIYEGASPVLNGYIHGLYAANPLAGLGGAIANSELPNDPGRMPSNWTGVVDLSGGRIGGETAGAVAVSTITWSQVQSLLLMTDQGNIGQLQQNPLGTHSLTWGGQQCDMTQVMVPQSRLSFFHLAAAAGKTITVDTLDVSSNQLVQTWDQLFDPATVKPRVLVASGNPSLTGSITAFPPNSVRVSAYGTGISGPLPAIPATLTTLQLTSNGLTAHPPGGYNNITTLDLTSAKLSGTVIANQAVNLALSGNSASRYQQFQAANAASSYDYNDIDLRNHLVALTTLYLGGSKVKNLWLPTRAGAVIGQFYSSYNADLVWANGFPAGCTFTGNFQAAFCNSSTTVFPLGTQIKGNFIDLSNNAMSETAVNSTVDAWLAHQAGFAGAATTKTLLLAGTNAAVTNADTGTDHVHYATRLQRLAQAASTNNWLVRVTPQSA
jgi:hypothetical protein